MPKKGKRLQWRLADVPDQWADVTCMAEVYSTLENLPYNSVELRVHPDDRDLPVRPAYCWPRPRRLQPERTQP